MTYHLDLLYLCPNIVTYYVCPLTTAIDKVLFMIIITGIRPFQVLEIYFHVLMIKKI